MPREIHPISGQPGLFRRGLGAAHRTNLKRYRRFGNPELLPLEGTLWTATVGSNMIPAPFGNRGYRSTLAELDAYALPQDFKLASVPLFRQEDMQAGQVPGVVFKLIVFSSEGRLLPKDMYDLIFRNLFAQMGYDVSSGELGAQTVKWAYVQDKVPSEDGTYVWNAVQTEGPAETQGNAIFYTSGGVNPPTAWINSYPLAQTYSLTLRPQDGLLTAEKVKDIAIQLRPARAKITAQANSAQGSKEVFSTDTVLVVKGVPPAFKPTPVPVIPPSAPKYGVGLSLLGIGWMAFLSMQRRM